MSNNFKNMSVSDLHNFQQAMAEAKQAEAKQAKTKAWQEQEGARINTLRNGILSKMNAKQPDLGLLKRKEDKLIGAMHEFQLTAGALGDLAKATHQANIRDMASEVHQLQFERDQYRKNESLLSDVPIANEDVFGVDAEGLNGIVQGIKSHRQPEDMPKLDKAHIIERAQSIVFDPTSEPPADWQPSPSE